MEFIQKVTHTNRYKLVIGKTVFARSNDISKLQKIRDDYFKSIKIEYSSCLFLDKNRIIAMINGKQKFFHIHHSRYKKLAYIRAKEYIEETTNPESFDLNFI